VSSHIFAHISIIT
jgi:hypothetical protein